MDNTSTPSAAAVAVLRSFLAEPPSYLDAGVFGAIRDLFSEKGRAVSPLFMEAVAQAPVAITITDINATILFANQAFTDVTGYALQEVLGRNPSMLSDRTTPADVYGGLWEAITAQRPWRGKLVNRRKDGRSYVAEVHITPVVNGEGEITHYLGMHRDVTGVQALEREAENQRALIESVVDLAPVIIALVEERGRPVLDNHEFKKLVTDLDGEPGRCMLAALEQALGERWPQVWEAGGGFNDIEIQLTDSRGASRWFSCSGSPLDREELDAEAFFRAPGRRYLLLVAKEITVLRQQEEEARRSALEALLAEEELVQSMREALTGAIYTLQGPMNMISAAVGMLQRRGELNEPASSVLGVLRDALQAGQSALATLETCIPEESREAESPVNVNELLRDVLTICTQRLLSDGVMVDWRPARVLPAVLGRPASLRNMFKQLLDNAADAVSVRGWKPREVRISTRGLSGAVEIVVEDTGPGVPAADRRRVFEPFFSTKERRGLRVGMGLALVQEVVNRHGGTVGIDGEYGPGCRIRVLLPASGRDRSATADSAGRSAV